MVTGFEVLGAIAAAEGLAKDVAAIVARFVGYHKGVEDLATRFADDANLLASLKENLEKHNAHLSDSDKMHLSRVFNHIDQLLKRTKETLEKMEERRLRAKLIWAIFGQEMKEHETNLYMWTQRLGTRLIQLDSETKTQLAESFLRLRSRIGNDLGRNLASQNTMQFLKQHPPDSGLTLMDISDQIVLPLSGMALRETTRLKGSGEVLIVDLLRNPSAGVALGRQSSWVKEEVRRLSLVLAEVNPEVMHIPKLKGFFESPVSGRPFGLAYTLPASCQDVKTLSSLIRTSHPPGPSGKLLVPFHPLGERISLAREIATSIAYVHSLEWVHKSIRSDNIFVSRSFNGKKFPFVLGPSFLVGFEYARHASASSTGDTPGDWKLEIYRHPERQVFADELLPEFFYSRKHDVYSFGIVLLELGRWSSLEAIPDLFAAKTPDERKSNLIGLISRIPQLIGTKYADIVRKCLEVDDEGPSMIEILDDLEDLRI